jgi:acyl-CoA synthetase (AMP-forming)/AMP-acid ligase II
MPRQLHADPTGKFVHQVVLEACQRAGHRCVIVDTSLSPCRRITGSEYSSLVEQVARGFVTAGIQPGEVIAIFLANSWEYAVAYHAATLAGAIATPLNPTYQEREARYQLECSGAAFLVTDGIQIEKINLRGLPALRRVYTTRHPVPGTHSFDYWAA